MTTETICGYCKKVHPTREAARICDDSHRQPASILTTHPIAKAVMPAKADAVARAKKVAENIISQSLMDLEANGWNLNKVAPSPLSTWSRPRYQKAKRTRAMYEAFTTRVAQHEGKPWYNPERDPNIRAKDVGKCDAYIKEAADDAGAQYDAFVLKLVAKADEDKQCYGAQLEGSHVWGYSTLTVWKYNQVPMKWRTRSIVNVSKLGKVFNQWPTRKVK